MCKIVTDLIVTFHAHILTKSWLWAHKVFVTVYGFKILCEISKVPFEISHKILNPYIAKYAFYEVLKNLTTYDILKLWDLKS